MILPGALLAWGAVDYGVTALYVVVVLAVGVFFFRTQRSGDEFHLASRQLNWLAAGLSGAAALVGGWMFLALPGEAYETGLLPLLAPICLLAAAPLAILLALPALMAAKAATVHEYLGQRFGPGVQRLASGAFLVWRLLWCAGVLALPLGVLADAQQWSAPAWLAVLLAGGAAIAYVALGGMRAVAWAGVVQLALIVLGLALLISAVWWVEGGHAGVWQAAESYQRTELIQTQFDPTATWSLWTAAPALLLGALAWQIADQTLVQRWLAADEGSRRALLLQALAGGAVLVGLVYLGLCLTAYFQNDPQRMRPIWVANVDPRTRESITDSETRTQPLLDKQGRPRKSLVTGEVLMDPSSGEPLVEWRQELDAATLKQLIEQRRLIRPNTDEPLTSLEELLDPETGQLRIDRLATRETLATTGEIVVHRRSQIEMAPRLAALLKTPGAAGLVAAAVLAAAMSSFASGVLSLATSLALDWRGMSSPTDAAFCALAGGEGELTPKQEARLGRRLAVAMGVISLLAGLCLSAAGGLAATVCVNLIFAGPLAGLVLLAVLDKQATGPGVAAGLVLGLASATWATVCGYGGWAPQLWPFGVGLSPAWPVLIGAATSVIVGWTCSWFLGRPLGKEELRGLVFGAGVLGERVRVERKVQIEAPGQKKKRFKE